jgi:hypothetical protein
VEGVGGQDQRLDVGVALTHGVAGETQVARVAADPAVVLDDQAGSLGDRVGQLRGAVVPVDTAACGGTGLEVRRGAGRTWRPGIRPVGGVPFMQASTSRAVKPSDA